MNSVINSGILNRVYPLNKSRSKFIVPGMWMHNGKWQTYVCILGPFWSGIRLTPIEFENLISNENEIKKYFEDGSRPDDDLGLSAKAYITLSEICGNKSIILESSDGMYKKN